MGRSDLLLFGFLFTWMAVPSLSWIRMLEFPGEHFPIDYWNTTNHEEFVESLDTDPAEFLAYIHDPSESVTHIHHISRSVLRVTKDLMSFAPRSARPEARSHDSWRRMMQLQNLKDEDVNEFLRQQGIAVPPQKPIACDRNHQFYRSMDGSCNNLQNPCWGKAEEPYQRWMLPDYANGIDQPRRRVDGSPLPSPRQINQWVSGQFQQSSSTSYPYRNNLLVVWGQFVAHDVLLTPTVTLKVWNGVKVVDEKPKCCNTTAPHPDCFPIVMNYEDPYYPRGHCMDIVRSVASAYSPSSCSPLKLGRPREQINQLSAFIDASAVYGSSEKAMRKLREHGGKDAKLIMDYSSSWAYPPRRNATTSRCKAAGFSCDTRCFLAGEHRANENPILGAVHTLFAREHNRLVDALRGRSWDEETLFHVVRKIVGAMIQHITYREFLPLILGPSLMGIMNLTVPTTEYRYEPETNPSVFNVFATAAFRYGHSMLDSRQKRRGKRLVGSPLLSQDFFSMDEFCRPQHDPVGYLLMGQAEQNAQRVDCLFSQQLTNHLFAKNPNQMGLDILSLNIQRGRDHGLPSYTKWREVCGMPRVNDYSDLRGTLPDYIVDRLQVVYGPGNVNDVDLYVGGVSELPVNDGILGPTFTCIISRQFRNLKFGDRFWYENTAHPGAFTPAQIGAIRRVTLSSLLCLNTDARDVQEFSFLVDSRSSPKLPCGTILRNSALDLRLWP